MNISHYQARQMFKAPLGRSYGTGLQVPALSTTHELYLDYGFCGKMKSDGCVIVGITA